MRQMPVSGGSNQQLLTIREVAKILHVAENTLRNKHFREKLGLTVIRVGRGIRFSQDDVDEFILRSVEGQGH